MLLEGLLRSEGGLFGNRGGGGDGSGLTLLGCGLSDNLVNRGLEDGNGIRKRLARANGTLRVPALHAKRE